MRLMAEKKAIATLISIIVILMLILGCLISFDPWLKNRKDADDELPKDIKSRVEKIEIILSDLDEQLNEDINKPEYREVGFITNSKLNKWTAESANIQEAIDDLGDSGGDVWLPETTFDLYQDITIQNSHTRIHGLGESTLLILHDNIKIFSVDKNNIILENFSITGTGKIWFELGYNTFLNNINAYNLSPSWERAFTFFCFKLPHGKDRGGLYINNCHVNRCTLSGFMIYAEVNGSILHSVEFTNCSARWCGWDVNGIPSQSPWSVGFVFNEAKNPFFFRLQNLTVTNCEAYYNWESGFHFEWIPTQYNCNFYNCIANYNGQKLNYVSELPDEFYCTGFLNIKSGVNCYNCIANYNTAYGFTLGGGTLNGCTAQDNGIANILG